MKYILEQEELDALKAGNRGNVIQAAGTLTHDLSVELIKFFRRQSMNNSEPAVQQLMEPLRAAFKRFEDRVNS
jgi:hypothetical protein